MLTATRCLAVLIVLTSWSSVAQAGKIAGAWSLNYPYAAFEWGFTQRNPTSFAAKSEPYIFVEFEATSHMHGKILGNQFAGITSVEVLGSHVPTGVVIGTLDGDTMTGTITDTAFGMYELSGTRITPVSTAPSLRR